MTIAPFQNIILNSLDYVLNSGGYSDTELYFEQLTPLVILSQQAEEQGKTVEQVEDETNDSMENPATTEDSVEQTIEDSGDVKLEEIEKFVKPTFFKQEYEILKK
jgi:hypothetical protein